MWIYIDRVMLTNVIVTIVIKELKKYFPLYFKKINYTYFKINKDGGSI
jgi:hypothetical protein